MDAYFGYLNDPILSIIDQLLLKMGKPNDGWSTAVPGVTANYTSEHDAGRRNSPVVQKTGKDDTAEIGQIVVYENMPQQWVCVSSGASQDPGEQHSVLCDSELDMDCVFGLWSITFVDGVPRFTTTPIAPD